MQKLIISILCIFVITGSAYAKGNSNLFKQGVLQYKTGNYIGSMETMNKVVKNDPGDAIAHYYLAISYVKLGRKDEASKEYNNVISLNPASKLVDYAKKGLAYLNSGSDLPVSGTEQAPGSQKEAGGSQPEAGQHPAGGVPQLPEIKNLPQITNIPGVKAAGDYMSDKVKDTLREKELNKVINDANNNGQVDANSLKRLENFSNKKSEKVTPSKEEVAQAMQVLSASGMYQNYNPEAMQMNMLMNSLGGQNTSGMNSGYSNNPMASMMPFMMMGQGSGNSQKMDPQFIETMMTTMMMPGMMQLGGNNNDNSNY